MCSLAPSTLTYWQKTATWRDDEAKLLDEWHQRQPEVVALLRRKPAVQAVIYGQEVLSEQLGPYSALCRTWTLFSVFQPLLRCAREFLQALFIALRIYPIAYDKWIQEQIVEILGLPELYAKLVGLLEIRDFESDEILSKAEALRGLFDAYAPMPPQPNP